MPLQLFCFPFPQTRFFKAGSYLYKFMIKGGSTYSEVDATEHLFSLEQEMEDIIRTVLGNLESLQPFSSTHFHVHPYKKPWESMYQVICRHSEKELIAYPFTLILYLERNSRGSSDELTAEAVVREHEEEELQQSVCEPPVKRQKTNPPLEDAILKDLVKDMAAESEVSMVRPGTKLLPLQDSEEDSQPEDKSDYVEAVAEQDDDQEAIAEKTPVQAQKFRKLARRLFPFSLFFRGT